MFLSLCGHIYLLSVYKDTKRSSWLIITVAYYFVLMNLFQYIPWQLVYNVTKFEKGAFTPICMTAPIF